MCKTRVDRDDRLLIPMKQVLGTSSTEKPSPRAPDKADARRRKIEALSIMDGLDLTDEHLMANAWRS
jgi:hypothetical protein